MDKQDILIFPLNTPCTHYPTAATSTKNVLTPSDPYILLSFP